MPHNEKIYNLYKSSYEIRFLQQGEGAPIVRKGTCANHIRDVEKLLKGAHITITARSEDDVEVDTIMAKLARATASAYKFNEPRGENEGHTGPIGTTYRRYISNFLSFTI